SRTFIGVSLRARRWLPGGRTQRGAIAAALVVGLILPGIALAQSARPLHMSEALRQAAAGNPRLAAARIEIYMAYGRRVQAGAIPNPELSFELDNALG
ncbi:hypothetical protein G6O45_31480, partial [Salmonella enterica subsp. enterica serovar Istanbul]|nr:hypothetical protein [Salmonella enterica subsp. enterica serovar Istanbul]